MSAAATGRAPLSTLLRLAWRESRTARRRLLLYMSSISLGVAALVAIDSFAANTSRSVREQSKSLVGGDLVFGARTVFTPAADSVLDSVAAKGATLARLTTFASMGSVVRTGSTRLVQVRAVSEAYPLYGAVVTSPPRRWEELQGGRNALVDPGLLIALDARVGDSLTIGYARFAIVGALESVPGDPGIAAAIGPRVFIPARYVPETQLLTFGSRADYEVLARLDESIDPAEFVAPFRKSLDAQNVRVRTVEQNESGMTESIDEFGRFLGVVGLVALMLGGIGVGSGVSAFVTRKIDTVAVLRCLGATSNQVLLIYLTQAAAMGLLGAAAGAALGVAIQFGLPGVIRDFLPVDVTLRLEPTAIASGLLLGLWVALAFALRPLIGLRHVSPLQALRRDMGSDGNRRRWWKDAPRLVVDALIVASVVFVAATRAGNWRETAALAGGIAGALVLLTLSAGMLSALARRLLRAGWPYVVRQGVANLYRPANQTRAVVLALGFGAFLITTLYLVQTGLLRQFQLAETSARGNMLFFDVQEDQGIGLDSMVRQGGHEVVQRVPLVSMRVHAVNGRLATDILADTLRQPGPDSARRARGWTLRREYRSTFRGSMTTSERLVSGRWFGETPAQPGQPAAELSLERELMEDMNVKLGDVITWDVQGVKVPARITSVREVEWTRFEPNFFAVFDSTALGDAPRMWLILAKVPEGAEAARLQRAVVERYPNVSSIDLSLVRRTIGEIVDRVSVAVRFLALFSLAMGIPVLFSAVAATRRERVREGVLLKTLGATRRQIRRILLAEYALLGVLGALTGMVLAHGGAWLLLRFVFERPFVPATGPALAIAAAMVLLTVTIGVLSGRDVFRETPMAALREA